MFGLVHGSGSVSLPSFPFCQSAQKHLPRVWHLLLVDPTGKGLHFSFFTKQNKTKTRQWLRFGFNGFEWNVGGLCLVSCKGYG